MRAIDAKNGREQWYVNECREAMLEVNRWMAHPGRSQIWVDGGTEGRKTG